MKHLSIVISFSLIFAANAISQVNAYNPFYVPRSLPDKDSLKAIVQNSKDPIQKLIALRELGHTYYENKRDSALYYFEQSITAARNIKSRLWEADACNSIGFVSYVQGNYPRGLQFLTQAVSLAEDPASENGEWKPQVSGFVSPRTARLSILARSYQHLAVLYGYTGNYSEYSDKELYYFGKALEISTSLGDKAMMGIINMNTARHYSFGPHLDSTIFYKERAMELMNEAGYSRYIGTLMFNLGEAYRRHQQPEMAKQCYWYGMEAGKSIENTRSVADNALALANIYQAQLNTDSAVYYGRVAANRYKSTLILSGLADSYAILSSAFNTKNSIDSAFHYQGLSLATRKELDADDKVRRFQQISFDEQIKAQEAAEKDRQVRNRIITSFLLAGLAILALIGVFLYRNNLARKKANQLLEEKNKELEIESALEKVRTRSLGMHKSEELQEVTNTVFEQMRALKIEAQTITIFITIEGSKDYNCWLQNDEQNYFSAIKFPYIKGNTVSEDHQMGSGDIESKTYERDLKDDWFHFMFTKSEMRNIPESRKRFVLDAAYFTASVAEMKYTKIGLYRYTDKAFTNQEYRILKRFAQVFEQAYIRFLDLEKAEGQAREAQIEAALERVRSRTMAMHKSDELKDVIQVVYEQFVHLNMHVEHSGFIIDYKNRDDMHIWLADPNRVPSEIFIPYFDSPHWNSFIEAKSTGKDLFTNLLNFEEKNKFYQGLFNFFPIPDETRKFYLTCPGLAISTVLIDNVGLYIENFSGKPYTEEENTVLMRFGKVFQQTYTRFLDLQKAEAQAREAQIGMAMERIRARALAMHSSSELLEVANVLREQMGLLNQPDLETSAVLIFHNDLESWDSWYAFRPTKDITGKIRTGTATFYKDSCAFTREIAEHFISPENAYTLETSGEKREEWIKVLMKAAPEIAENAVNDEIENFDTTYFHFSDFKGGSLLTVSYLPPSDEIKSLQQRAANVFDLAYRRFLDLKKAEAQAREAQIETALERIRSRSMAMHKSEELSDLSLELVKQVQALGVATWFCAFNIYDDDANSSLEWGSNGQGVFPKYRTPREGIFLRYYEAGQRGETLLINEIGEEECPAHYDYLCTLPGVGDQLLEMKAAGIPFPTHQIDHVVFFKYGYLLFITYEPVPETHDIFKRFARVFEQSYTRFLDLKTAEAQAREAQIEAALERVRSRSLAMHHTDELQDVVNVAAQQLLKMNIDIDGGMFIAINDEVKDDLPFWAAAGAADYVQKVTLPYFDRPTFTGLRDAILRRDSFYTEHYSKEEKDEFMRFMFNHHPWNQNSEEKKRELLAREGGYARSLVVNRYTSIGMTNHHGKIFSDADNAVLKRFGAVVEQSYTRFLDLQKAETQAREAQIEAALERVRSKTMAMSNSDDVGETVATLFAEFSQLGIHTNRCGILIFDNEDYAEVWTARSNADGKASLIIGMLDLNAHQMLRSIYNAWRDGRSSHRYDLKAGDLISYYDAINRTDLYPVKFDLNNLPAEEFHSDFYFPEGTVFAFSPNPIEDEHARIMKRFAGVFGQTYRRYLDLQKAEAGAKEAIKQAALDRIRAEIASMRTKQDLDRITPLIWTELKILNIPFLRCGIFIMDDAVQQIHTFLSAPDGRAIASFNLAYDNSANISAVVGHWQQNKTYVEHWNLAEFNSLADSLVQQGYIKTREQYTQTLPADGLFLHFVPFMQGMLYAGNKTALGADEISLLQAVADAFSTAYARYEDFNKVEKTLYDLRQTQKQLVQAEKMASLGELTAGIAHEIQNPLNFVNNFSEINVELVDEINEAADKGDIEEIKALAADIRSNQEKIREHGRRADGIVKGMLQHSRTGGGSTEPTDLNVLAEEYLRLAFHGLRAKDKSFQSDYTFHPDPSLGKVNIVPQDIGRVLLNLINNAFYVVQEKAATGIKDYKPRVEVSTERKGKTVVLTVKDNGNGIPENIKDKIFQPFFTTKPTGQGTGLGLSLSYDIVKAHGGELKVGATGKTGTTFEIMLPG